MTVSSAERRLRVLHVEDSELDHQLIVAQLRRAGLDLEVHRVDTLAEVAQALTEAWDAIVSDYNLPGFSGLVVLDMLKESKRLIPFVLVSGEIGEDTAVAAMRTGASDYLLKNNLARLAPALLHAIEANDMQCARLEADRELRKSKQRLHELAGHLQTSVEMERAAIAREIHDDVGGSLTALKFDLAWIARHAQDAAVRQRVQSALETVSYAIEASQRIMHNLRPAILEQGLVAAVQWMSMRFERRTGITTTMRTSHEQIQLPAGVPLVAYRTAQEALTNVSKHANASRVDIELSVDSGVLTLEVSDNGQGVAPGDLAKARSFGIRGLHERAATVGGWVDLSSNSRGTSLILSVPLEAPDDSLADDEAGRAATHDPSAWGSA
ncbi:response regulator [Paucibacter sp. O1-1]|uniref:hybrid sensor histidine kinase/response regulator n=1 Tax=Paucibacter sp. M5-1 TaxID=3015998 RepID=UPI0021D4CC42|nr:response regulator [Paucibacter sp. M5-1]MCU7376617.1 response regulator [Paucibacter sp. O1-1]MCZ7884023.1 response regulator [Paucibacter sp. M5-1]MDA3831636.1 response regulator [Paucibacter sp. O1-1]